ncbi:NUDIX domain-containing protein [Roseovarius albus]|nr:NUDIX domain-containing protein [Roseovarius albus]
MVYRPLLNLVVGCSDLSTLQTENLQHAALSAEQACFPFLIRVKEQSVEGLLLSDLTEAELERLTFFSNCIGGEAGPYDGMGTSKIIAYWSVVADQKTAQDHDADLWVQNWSAIALEAAQEIMGYFRLRSASEVRAGLQMILLRAHARVEAATGVPANVRSAKESNQVDIVHQDSPHAGYFVTRDFSLRHPTFAGGQSPIVRREVFVATDAAIVLPYDPVNDRVMLVEQFRMGPFGRGDVRPWMLEPVAGRIDPGETPESTARRECEEEAGLTLHRLEKISSHYSSPGCSTEYFHLFLGVCDLPNLDQGQGGLDAEHEDIRTHVLPFDQAMDLLTTGEADNGPLVLSLLWLARERERLRSAA